MAAVCSVYLLSLQKQAQTKVIYTCIVGNNGQLLRTLRTKRSDKIFWNSTKSEAANKSETRIITEYVHVVERFTIGNRL